VCKVSVTPLFPAASPLPWLSRTEKNHGDLPDGRLSLRDVYGDVPERTGVPRERAERDVRSTAFRMGLDKLELLPVAVTRRQGR